MYGGFFGLPGTSAVYKLPFLPECSISYVFKIRSRSLPYFLLLSPSCTRIDQVIIYVCSGWFFLSRH